MAILVALRHWKAKLGYSQLTLTVQSDSVTALALTRRLAAKTAGLNFIGAELALLFEECQVQEVAQRHVPGRFNEAPDYLSRPSKWPEVPQPAALQGVNVVAVPGRDATFYRLPTPGAQPSLWGPMGDHPWWRQ